MMWPQHSGQIIWYWLCRPEYYPSNIITSSTLADFSGRLKSLTALGIYSRVPHQPWYLSAIKTEEENDVASCHPMSRSWKNFLTNELFTDWLNFLSHWLHFLSPEVLIVIESFLWNIICQVTYTVLNRPCGPKMIIVELTKAQKKLSSFGHLSGPPDKC